MRVYYVYILTNYYNTIFYVGVTNNLRRRVGEHKDKFGSDSFAKKYNINKLVYFEEFLYINDAIAAEKRLKHWKQKWKRELIEYDNKDYLDLSDDWE